VVGGGWALPARPRDDRRVRPGTTIALGVLLLIIFAAAAIQFLTMATH